MNNDVLNRIGNATTRRGNVQGWVVCIERKTARKINTAPTNTSGVIPIQFGVDVFTKMCPLLPMTLTRSRDRSYGRKRLANATIRRRPLLGVSCCPELREFTLRRCGHL